MKEAINLLVVILISTLSIPVLQAQDIDRDRMNRDLNIMENILEEMFKTSWKTEGGDVRIFSEAFSFSRSNNISGTYLDDYGVIFTIPSGPSALVISRNPDEATFHYSTGHGKKITEESVVKRITEFLRDYGSTIGQLQNDDHITVIYQSKQSRIFQVNFLEAAEENSSQKKAEENKSLPTIYVSAQKSDLQAYRQGQFAEAEFQNRLSISTIEDSGNKHRDLKIMANILKTAFEDTETDVFKIRGSVNHLYIDDLGALFYADASYGSGLFGLETVAISIRKKLADIAGEDSIFYEDKLQPNSKKMSESELQEQAKQAYQKFMSQLKTTLIDYGRTLKSVQSDERVIISVSLPEPGADLPERVRLQIKKSVLEAFDSGKMSRKQAIDRIILQEY